MNSLFRVKLTALILMSMVVSVMAFAGGTDEAVADKQTKLAWWWYGTEDVAKMPGWVEAVVKKYQAENPQVDIEAINQPLDTLIPSFKAAAAAKEGPDIAFFWGGIWCLEDVWEGSIAPLSDYWSMDDFKHIIRWQDRFWNGKVWGVGLYLSGKPLIYNKKLFANAGLDPLKPPSSRDAFLKSCEKLKKAGITPLGVGLKDLWQGEWMFSIYGGQYLDSAEDMVLATIGRTKLTEPKYATWWGDFDSLVKQGYYNNDISSLGAEEGWDIFPQGKVAMVMASDARVSYFMEELGPDAVGVAKVPPMGSGKLAGKYFLETNGYSITSWSKNKEQAAAFLKWLYKKDQVNQFYELTGTLPCSDQLSSSLIKQAQLKQMWQWSSSGATGPHLGLFYPSMLDEQGYMAGVSRLATGELTPPEAAALTQEILEKWRNENPDKVKNYEKWLVK